MEDALRVLLEALREHSSHYTPPEAYKAGIVAIPVHLLIEGEWRSRKQSRVDNLYAREAFSVFDPVQFAFRNALKDLGQRIFELTGSTAGMSAVFENVCGESVWKAEVLDKVWNSIGEGEDKCWS